MSQVIWGVNPVIEALNVRPQEIEEIWLHKLQLKGKKYQILEKARALEIPVKVVNRKDFFPPKVPKEANTQGVVAYLSEFRYATLEDIEAYWKEKKEIPLVVVLDQVEDPQNLGSIIRTADAAGAHGVVIPKHRACEVTGTVIKVSSGAVFNLPIAKVSNIKNALKFFKEKGLWVLGLDLRGNTFLYKLDLTIPLVVVAGNEARGIRQSVLKECDFLVKIPMKGKVESLNVGVSVGVTLFEVLRQRLSL